MQVRHSAVAGIFYPNDPNELKGMIFNFLEKAKEKKIQGQIRALILPHAGYIYSGIVAASGFKLLQNLNRKLKYKVIILGPSHYVWFEGAALSKSEYFLTPLGKIKVVKLNIDNLSILHYDDEPHIKEHSLEVQIPFLQLLLKEVEIMPIVIGEVSYKTLAEEINQFIDKSTIIVASSDLSHYLSYEEANRIDKFANESIPALDIEKSEKIEACGKTGILTLLSIAKKRNWKGVFLDYKNSADTAGLMDKVVGYGAYAFYA